MSAVKVHGIVLVVVLLIAFQTWTRDDSTSANDSGVAATVWEGRVDEIASITYQNPTRTLRVERREETDDAARPGETFLWGTAQTTTADSAAIGAAREEFPVGDAGDDLLRRLASLPALRDLGELGDEAKAEYELTEPERTLTVTFASGEREITLGGNVFGAGHRYALDPMTGRGYVISNDVLRALEGGWATLQSRKLHRYDAADVAGISVRTATGQRRMVREGNGRAATWTSPGGAGQPDQTFANFVERLQQLSIIRYDVELNVDTLQLVVRIEDTGESGNPLGFLEIFRGPANFQGIAEFYLRTEATHIPAHANRRAAERVAQDLADIL